MSVLLDALRRARGQAVPRPPSVTPGPAPPPIGSRGVPAGLRVGGGPRPSAGRGSRWFLLLPIVIVLGTSVAVWMSLSLMTGRPVLKQPTAQPMRPPAAAAVPATHASADAGPSVVTGGAGVTARDSAQARSTAVEEPLQERAAVRLPAQPTNLDDPPPPSRVGASQRSASTRPPRAAATLPATRPAARTQEPAPPTPVAAPPALTAPVVAGVSPVPNEDHFKLAAQHHSLGNFEQAQKHYLAVIESDPFNIEARNNLGLLYHARGLANEAVDQFRRAVGINPRYLKARSNMAVVLMETGRLAEARAQLREALGVEPRSVDLLVNLALVEKAAGQPGQAQEILIRALGYQPTHAVAHYNLAVLYEETGSIAAAYDHFSVFLKHAGPEHGALLTGVQRRLQQLDPAFDVPRRP